MAARIAIVTGGASGIGRAVAAALVAAGDTVTLADIDKDGAQQVAADLTTRGPGTATAALLDVTDAAAVEQLYRAVKDEHGRLDLVFNNAGIAVAGAVEELTLDHWNKTIDVNLRGVVHGVHAAYPIMLEQGFGHIVNTASLAGLVPAPLIVPYTATKHAVVGLSLALRAEAASRGVKVSAVCPSFVNTPLLDRTNPDLPQTAVGRSGRDLVMRLRPYTPEKLARDIMRGIKRNKPLIVAPASGRAAWRGVRFAPRLSGGVAARAAVQVRRRTRAS